MCHDLKGTRGIHRGAIQTDLRPVLKRRELPGSGFLPRCAPACQGRDRLLPETQWPTSPREGHRAGRPVIPHGADETRPSTRTCVTSHSNLDSELPSSARVSRPQRRRAPTDQRPRSSNPCSIHRLNRQARHRQSLCAESVLSRRAPSRHRSADRRQRPPSRRRRPRGRPGCSFARRRFPRLRSPLVRRQVPRVPLATGCLRTARGDVDVGGARR
jgi:hypothetical protein